VLISGAIVEIKVWKKENPPEEGNLVLYSGHYLIFKSIQEDKTCKLINPFKQGQELSVQMDKLEKPVLIPWAEEFASFAQTKFELPEED